MATFCINPAVLEPTGPIPLAVVSRLQRMGHEIVTAGTASTFRDGGVEPDVVETRDRVPTFAAERDIREAPSSNGVIFVDDDPTDMVSSVDRTMTPPEFMARWG